MASALRVVAFVLLSWRCGAGVLPQRACRSTRCREMYLPTRRGIEHEVICSFDGVHNYTASVLPDTYFNLYCKASDIPDDVQAHLGLAGSLSKYFLLSRCPLPTSSYADIMKKLGVSSVKELKIRNTTDTSLRRKHLEGLEELSIENLNLYDNNLKHIEQDAFEAVPNIIQLELSFNEGLRLSAGIFQPLKQLRVLRLSKMGLQELPEHLFNISTLEELFLGRNTLRLTSHTFDGLTNLKTLNLCSNSLTDLPVDVFKPLINLKSIDISFNNLSTIPSGLFRHNKNLTQFSIAQKIDGTDPEEFLSYVTENTLEESGCNFIESKPGFFIKKCSEA